MAVAFGRVSAAKRGGAASPTSVRPITIAINIISESSFFLPLSDEEFFGSKATGRSEKKKLPGFNTVCKRAGNRSDIAPPMVSPQDGFSSQPQKRSGTADGVPLEFPSKPIMSVNFPAVLAIGPAPVSPRSAFLQDSAALKDSAGVLILSTSERHAAPALPSMQTRR